MSVPQVNTECKNWLCNDIRAYILFSIKDENDEHLLSTLTFNIIKFKKGLKTVEIKVDRRAFKKAWKARVKPEAKLWSSEDEVKNIIKTTFMDFTLLYPPPYIGSFTKK